MTEAAPVTRPGFDRVVRVYPLLERLVYGQRLGRGRCVFLGELSTCRNLLLLGEGNGRFLSRLLAANPLATVTVVEISPRMIAAARSRLSAAEAARVRWVQASALDLELPPGSFDAVVTHYFFDLFRPHEQARLLQTGLCALAPDGLWQDTEFLGAAGRGKWWRLRNRLLLLCSYHFLGALCDFPARELFEHSHLFAGAGLVLKREHVLSGTLASRLWLKAPAG